MSESKGPQYGTIRIVGGGTSLRAYIIPVGSADDTKDWMASRTARVTTDLVEFVPGTSSPIFAQILGPDEVAEVVPQLAEREKGAMAKAKKARLKAEAEERVEQERIAAEREAERLAAEKKAAVDAAVAKRMADERTERIERWRREAEEAYDAANNTTPDNKSGATQDDGSQ